MSTRTTRTEKLDLRLTHSAKRTLEAAASVTNRTLSAFVLESALARADETLMDRRAFVLDAQTWQSFLTALNAPPRSPPRMQRLLTEPGFFGAPTEDR